MQLSSLELIIFFSILLLISIAFFIGYVFGEREGYLKGKIQGVNESNKRIERLF